MPPIESGSGADKSSRRNFAPMFPPEPPTTSQPQTPKQPDSGKTNALEIRTIIKSRWTICQCFGPDQGASSTRRAGGSKVNGSIQQASDPKPSRKKGQPVLQGVVLSGAAACGALLVGEFRAWFADGPDASMESFLLTTVVTLQCVAYAYQRASLNPHQKKG